MTELPSWMQPAQPLARLVQPEEPPLKPSPEAKALMYEQFDSVFHRVLDLVYAGSTLSQAIKQLPIDLDVGSFYRWLKKDPERYGLYIEAKEARTEVWAGKVIDHATGVDPEGNPSMDDVQRSKLIVDTYKWLMGADNKKVYGDTKTIDVTGGISITAALNQANDRLGQLIDAEFEEISETQPTRLLEAGDEDE